MILLLIKIQKDTLQQLKGFTLLDISILFLSLYLIACPSLSLSSFSAPLICCPLAFNPLSLFHFSSSFPSIPHHSFPHLISLFLSPFISHLLSTSLSTTPPPPLYSFPISISFILHLLLSPIPLPPHLIPYTPPFSLPLPPNSFPSSSPSCPIPNPHPIS